MSRTATALYLTLLALVPGPAAAQCCPGGVCLPAPAPRFAAAFRAPRVSVTYEDIAPPQAPVRYAAPAPCGNASCDCGCADGGACVCAAARPAAQTRITLVERTVLTPDGPVRMMFRDDGPAPAPAPAPLRASSARPVYAPPPAYATYPPAYARPAYAPSFAAPPYPAYATPAAGYGGTCANGTCGGR